MVYNGEDTGCWSVFTRKTDFCKIHKYLGVYRLFYSGYPESGVKGAKGLCTGRLKGPIEGLEPEKCLSGGGKVCIRRLGSVLKARRYDGPR